MPYTQSLDAKKPTGKDETSDIVVVARGGRRLRLPQIINAQQAQVVLNPKPSTKNPNGLQAMPQDIHAKVPVGMSGAAQILTKDLQGKQAGIKYILGPPSPPPYTGCGFKITGVVGSATYGSQLEYQGLYPSGELTFGTIITDLDGNSLPPEAFLSGANVVYVDMVIGGGWAAEGTNLVVTWSWMGESGVSTASYANILLKMIGGSLMNPSLPTLDSLKGSTVSFTLSEGPGYLVTNYVTGLGDYYDHTAVITGAVMWPI